MFKRMVYTLNDNNKKDKNLGVGLEGVHYYVPRSLNS